MKRNQFIILGLLILLVGGSITWALKRDRNETKTSSSTSIKNPLRVPPEPPLVERRDEEFKKSENSFRSFDPKIESSLLKAIRFFQSEPKNAALVTF